jgi:hypothetical protein
MTVDNSVDEITRLRSGKTLRNPSGARDPACQYELSYDIHVLIILMAEQALEHQISACCIRELCINRRTGAVCGGPIYQ